VRIPGKKDPADSGRIGPPSSSPAPAAGCAGAFLAPLAKHDPRLDHSASMSPGETIIQLLKIVIGIAFGAYFVCWSLEVLQRLPH
jgi:hypothetical protein